MFGNRFKKEKNNFLKFFKKKLKKQNDDGDD